MSNIDKDHARQSVSAVDACAGTLCVTPAVHLNAIGGA